MYEKDKAACQIMKRLRRETFHSNKNFQIMTSPSYMGINGGVSNNTKIRIVDTVVMEATEVDEATTEVLICNITSFKISRTKATSVHLIIKGSTARNRTISITSSNAVIIIKEEVTVTLDMETSIDTTMETTAEECTHRIA